MSSLRALVVAAVVAILPASAEAGAEKAWAAAKSNLPRETSVLVGLDLTQLTRSSLFSMMFPVLLSQQPDVKAGLELVRTKCKIDPLKAVQGVVVGTDPDQKHGAIFLAVDGLDQAKIASCLEVIVRAKLAEAPPNAKAAAAPEIAIATDGKITEIAIGDADKVYLRWIGTDVLVVPLKFDSRADLQKWTGAKALSRSAVARGAARVNTRSAMWAVSAVTKELDDNVKMKLGYGALTVANAMLGADLHVQVGTAAQAKAASDKAAGELATLAAGPGLDANLKALLQQISVAAVGNEIVVKGNLPEKDVLSLVGALVRP